MSRRTVLQIFVWTLVGVIAGLVLFIMALAALMTNHAFIMNGPDVVGLRSGPLTWTMIGIAVAGALLVIGGVIGQFVAWIGALVRTVGLDDKTWFVVLLVTGLLGVGPVGMIVYLAATKEPDVRPGQPQRPAFAGTC